MFNWFKKPKEKTGTDILKEAIQKKRNAAERIINSPFKFSEERRSADLPIPFEDRRVYERRQPA